MSDLPARVNAWSVLPARYDDAGNLIEDAVQPPPVVDVAQVTPTVDEVAKLERSRTVDDTTGENVGTFTDRTFPTVDDVEDAIGVATDEVLAQLVATNIDPVWYPMVRHVMALRSAALLEQSFFRTQTDASNTAGQNWQQQYEVELEALKELVARATFLA